MKKPSQSKTIRVNSVVIVMALVALLSYLQEALPETVPTWVPIAIGGALATLGVVLRFATSEPLARGE